MNRREILLLTSINVLCGTSYAIAKLLIDHIPSFSLTALRMGIACLAMSPIIWKAHGQLDRRQWRLLAVLGTTCMALPTWLQFIGVQYSTSTNGALFVGAEPVFVVILAFFILNEQRSRKQFAAVAISTLGIVLLATGGIPGFSTQYQAQPGDIALILSGVTWAGYSIISKILIGSVSAMTITAVGTFFGTLSLAPFAAHEWETLTRVEWTPAIIFLVLFLSLGLNLYAYWRWNTALETVSASDLALFINLQPLTGAIMGTLLLSEEWGAHTVIGGILILTGSTLATHGPAKQAPTTVAPQADS